MKIIVKEPTHDKYNTWVILLDYKVTVGLSIKILLTEETASADLAPSVANKHIISFWMGLKKTRLIW